MQGISWTWGSLSGEKKERGKQYHFTYYIKAVGKNINWGRREGYGNFWEFLFTPGSYRFVRHWFDKLRFVEDAKSDVGGDGPGLVVGSTRVHSHIRRLNRDGHYQKNPRNLI